MSQAAEGIRWATPLSFPRDRRPPAREWVTAPSGGATAERPAGSAAGKTFLPDGFLSTNIPPFLCTLIVEGWETDSCHIQEQEEW